MANEGYDPEVENRDSTGPDSKRSDPLSNSTAGGNPSFTRGDNLDPVRRMERGAKFYNPHGDSTAASEGGATSRTRGSDGGAITPTSGAGASKSADQIANREGGFTRGSMTSTSETKSSSSFFGSFGKKKLALAAGALGGAGITGALIFLLLIPLKIENMVQNLESHFFSSSENDVGDETDTMTENFVKGPLADAMRLKNTTCSKDGNVVVSKNCTLNFTNNNNNPVVNLYKTYSQSNLENTLADTYGIELRYDKGGAGTYYLKAPGVDGGETKVGDGVHGIDDNEFAAVDRGDVRQSFKNAEEEMTSWDKVMFRYKVGRLLEEKYGIKRCVVYCGKRDALADNSSQKKNAAKLFLTERVIGPRSAALGAVLNCILNTSDEACQNKEPSTTCTEGDSCAELGGEPQTEADADIDKAVGEVTSQFGSETAQQLISIISEERDAGGFQNYVMKKLLTQVFNEDIANKSVPVVGELQTLSSVASFINTAAKSPAALKKMSYLVNSTAAVSLYMMYRSYADEVHTGNVDATELGSFNNSLGPGNQCDTDIQGTCDQQLGGSADATQTPLYSSLNNDGSNDSASGVQTSFLQNLLPATAYADPTSGSSSYLCANGKPVPAGSLVCSEEKLGQGNGVISDVSSAFNDSGLASAASAYKTITAPISIFLNLFNGLFSWFSSGAESAFEAIPGVSGLVNKAEGLVGSFFTFIVKQIVPSPFSTEMSGGRTYDMMAAGADVSGNDYAHTGLGGRELSNQEAAQQVAEQSDTAAQQFSKEPLFARMFGTDSQYSLVSRVADDMPFNVQSAGESFASIIGNPFSSLANSFASIFAGRVSAAPQPIDDPFGVTQYGYTQSDLAAIGDPETYWDQHCSDNAAQGYQNNQDASNASTNWNDQAANYNTNDPGDDSGMPINTATNPCMLIMASTGSAGGALNSSMLTQDDLADLSSSSGGGGTSGSGTGGTGSSPVSGDPEQLAQTILSNNNIDLTCLSSSVQQDVQDAAKGLPGTAGAMTSAGILQIIATVGQSHKVCVTAIQSDGQGHCNGEPESVCPDDPHYTGHAVDFGSLDGTAITGRNAPALTIMQLAESVVSTGAFGQSECGTTPTLPSGWTDFDDTCNHLHVQDIAPTGSS
jgi:hypothetical protein